MTDAQMISIMMTIAVAGVTIGRLIAASTFFMLWQMNMFEARLTVRIQEVNGDTQTLKNDVGVLKGQSAACP